MLDVSGPDAGLLRNHIYRALFRFLHGHVLDDLQEPVENPVLAACDGAAELERGLDVVLTGLTTSLTPPGETRPPAPARHPAS